MYCDFPGQHNMIRTKQKKYEGFLKGVKVLSTVEPYELMKVTDAVKPASYKAGDTIIREGEEGKVFFLLESGEAYATKEAGKGKPAKKVMDYMKGSYFGELALIRNTPRAANIVAKVYPDKPTENRPTARVSPSTATASSGSSGLSTTFSSGTCRSTGNMRRCPNPS